MKAEYDVEVEWRAFELHPETPLEGRRFPAELRNRYAATFERLRQQARASGREMVASQIIPNSRRALEASEYAREMGKHEVFHQIVFRKLFGEAQNVGQWAVLRAAAEEAGLDPDEMQRKTEAGTYRAAVDAQIAEAQGYGITGVPTFIFDDRYAIVGAQPFAAFAEVMRRLGQAPRPEVMQEAHRQPGRS